MYSQDRLVKNAVLPSRAALEILVRDLRIMYRLTRTQNTIELKAVWEMSLQRNNATCIWYRQLSPRRALQSAICNLQSVLDRVSKSGGDKVKFKQSKVRQHHC